MPQESIEIQMLKQQVQLLQQELQQIHQYGNIRTLWNNIFSKLETITYTSQQPLKIYQQLMFRQSLSQDQIKPEYLTQDAGCQTDDDQIKCTRHYQILYLINQYRIENKLIHLSLYQLQLLTYLKKKIILQNLSVIQNIKLGIFKLMIQNYRIKHLSRIFQIYNQ
ncbi:unnamed protein product [Paramecium pentaurelia]|uniref:Uncharacterized protein n=1 Tax=Paramecium pentaurelia TaxID=43138 RepID=A0A8S1XI11_9CILI|nr:unnamed protein product [Paramecium pentaurelia]